MTSYRTTALLAFMLIALGIYVSTIEIPTMEKEAVQQTEAQRLLRFDYRDVTHVVYTTRTERIEMSRDERNRWRILEPVATRGDARQIGNVLRALEIGRVSRVIQEDGTTPEPYGLHHPHVTIEITTGEQTDAIALGATAPLSSALYAQRRSDEHILLTTLSVADFRKKTLNTFRLKDILPFDRAAVERIQLRTSNQSIALRRGDSFHGPSSHWNFTAPVQAPADTTAIGTLLMTLENLTATGFIDSQADKQPLLSKLRRPWMTATVHTRRNSHHVAFFPSMAPDEDAYAVTSEHDPVYRIPARILKQLPSDVFHLQDKRLFGMEAEEIALVTVKTGDWQYTLIQQHGAWHLEGRESAGIDQQTVILFVSRLVDLPAELSISRTQDNLERYALAPPAIEIIGIDRKGRRRGLLALGTRTKGLVYAMGAGLPGIYQVRSLIVTQIPSSKSLEDSA